MAFRSTSFIISKNIKKAIWGALLLKKTELCRQISLFLLCASNISLNYSSQAKVLWNLCGCCFSSAWLLGCFLACLLVAQTKTNFCDLQRLLRHLPSPFPQSYQSSLNFSSWLLIKQPPVCLEGLVWKQIQVIRLSPALRMAIKLLHASFRTYFTWNLGNKSGEMHGIA